MRPKTHVRRQQDIEGIRRRRVKSLLRRQAGSSEAILRVDAEVQRMDRRSMPRRLKRRTEWGRS